MMPTIPEAHKHTVVFVGPSCSSRQVKDELPGALIAPPVRRGDLYRYRLLNFSVFVVLDGVFTSSLAVSPREVVDVIADGATVIGASSMGALRAVDCGPAGAIGYGRIFRLFRRRAISSEDEVALSFFPEPPYQPLSVPLVNVRFALRRAQRTASLAQTEAQALLDAALQLPYQLRDWATIAKSAQVALSHDQYSALQSCDVKQEDALLCCRMVASHLSLGTIALKPRPDRNGDLGALFLERERSWDPLDGENFEKHSSSFVCWLWASGQGRGLFVENELTDAIQKAEYGAIVAEIVSRAPASELAAMQMRFTGFRRACFLAQTLSLNISPRDLSRSKTEIVQANCAESWDILIERLDGQTALLKELHAYSQARARILVFTRRILFGDSSQRSAALPVWRRSEG
ncbi:TfuA-like protein [Pseudahrensia aquimaris]|uniref:TfuA-like protein n=1 Tax=Pseudahrensia aquimaris TaxID=744461 RepID=A0ABW3FFM9_9HYPH